MNKKLSFFLLITFVSYTGLSQSVENAKSGAYVDTLAKERLEQHVYTFASDSLQGRKTGTKYAKMAACCIALGTNAVQQP
jgi:hypothetical protein